MGTLLLDLRPEAGYTFDPFGSTNLLQKGYVCVCEKFLCSLFCPIGTHIFCDVISLLAQVFIVSVDRAYKEESTKKY